MDKSNVASVVRTGGKEGSKEKQAERVGDEPETKDQVGVERET